MSRFQIFLVEDTGEGFVEDSFACAKCHHRTKRDRGRCKEADRPEDGWGTKGVCEQCGEVTEMVSQGFNAIFRRADNGAEVGGHEKLPAGAVYNNTDYAYGDHPRPDENWWICVLPDGTHWHIDAQASSGGYWTRKGHPAKGDFDVKPSIRIGRTKADGGVLPMTYHGHINNGWIESCSDSPC